MDLPVAQQQVLAAFALAPPVLIGWGSVFRRVCGYGVRTADDLFRAAFEGWALLLGALQLWHLFLPVDARATVAAVAVGTGGLVLWTGRAWIAAARGLVRNLPALALILAAAVWLSGLALHGPRHGDAGAYYIPTTMWVHDFPLVVGLANLFPPYGYNQSYFLYAAAVAVGPFLNRPWHIVNAVLVMVLLARGLLGWWRLVGRRRPAGWTDLAYAFLVPGEVALCLSIWLTSQAPDTGIFLIGAGLFASILRVARGDAASARFHVLAATLFACAGWTIKISFAGMAAALVLVVPLAWWWRWRPSARELGATALAMGAIAVLMLGPWLAANVATSGCPLFPSALGALDVPWRVRVDVQALIEGDKSVGPLSALWRDPGSVGQQFLVYGWGARDVAMPLLAGAAAIPVAIVATAARRRRRRSLPWWILIPPLASLVFAARLTPMPRYAGASMWLFGISAVLIACGDWLRRTRLGRAVAAVAVIAMGMAVGSRAALETPLRDFEAVPTFPVEARTLASGLTVNVPAGGVDACFAAPLPCAPHPDPRLALRRGGDPGSGFIVDPGTSR